MPEADRSGGIRSTNRSAEAQQRARIAARGVRKPGGCKKCAERAAERAKKRAAQAARSVRR